MTAAPARQPLEDRVVWVRFPGTAWVWLWAAALVDVAESLTHDTDSPWESPWLGDAKDREHIARCLLALREAVRQAAPADLDERIARCDEDMAELFARLEFVVTPVELQLVRSLVCDTERDAPQAMARLRAILGDSA